MIWAYDTQATKTLEVWKPKYGEKKWGSEKEVTNQSLVTFTDSQKCV